MKLHEIREYDPDDANNTPSRFVEDIFYDLEDVISADWHQERNGAVVFNFDEKDKQGERVEFKFYYKRKPNRPDHHTKTGGFTLINAHSVNMTIYFAKSPMNLANLHDDPEIQKKLQAKMKLPLSYFEKNTDELEEVLEVMKRHGADAVSVGQTSIDFDVNQALKKIEEARLREKDDLYHYVEFSFLFLTQPLQN